MPLQTKISEMLQAGRMNRKIEGLLNYIGIVVKVREEVEEALEIKIRELETGNASTSALQSQQETRIEKLEKEVKDARKERESLVELLSQYQETITKLEGTAADALKKSESATAQMSLLQSKIKELESATTQVPLMQLRIKEVESVKTEVPPLQKEIDCLKGRVSAVEESKKALNERIDKENVGARVTAVELINIALKERLDKEDASNKSKFTSEHLQSLKDIKERRTVLDGNERDLVKEADATIKDLLNNISFFLGVYGLTLQQVVNNKEYWCIIILIAIMLSGILGLIYMAYSKLGKISGHILDLEEKHTKVREAFNYVKSNNSPGQVTLDVQESLLDHPRFKSTEKILAKDPATQKLDRSYWVSFCLIVAYALSIPIFLFILQIYGKKSIMFMPFTDEIDVDRVGAT